MRHGPGYCKAPGDSGPCNCHVRSGTESAQDSVRSFACSFMLVVCFLRWWKTSYYSVDIILSLSFGIANTIGIVVLLLLFLM